MNNEKFWIERLKLEDPLEKQVLRAILQIHLNGIDSIVDLTDITKIAYDTVHFNVLFSRKGRLSMDIKKEDVNKLKNMLWKN